MAHETSQIVSVNPSLTGRFWTLRHADEAHIRALSPYVDGDDLRARLMAVCGVDAQAAEGYLAPTLRAFFPDPETFQDMMRAAGLVLDAIVEGQSVTVFADYDVDGGTASALWPQS